MSTTVTAKLSIDASNALLEVERRKIALSIAEINEVARDLGFASLAPGDEARRTRIGGCRIGLLRICDRLNAIATGEVAPGSLLDASSGFTEKPEAAAGKTMG